MKELGPLIHSFWYLLRGAGMTVLMATSAMVPATLLGVLLALLQVFGGWLLRSAILGYLFLIRGIPLLVLLTFVYYLLPLTGIDLPPFWGVVLVISLYYAAFISEVFRAGILSLPGQGNLAGLDRRPLGADDGEPRGRRAHPRAVSDLHRRGGDLFLHLLYPRPLWKTP
jgi:His/Glu/Gln/Arg/opine family amino acid ABC transporter permease subunit